LSFSAVRWLGGRRPAVGYHRVPGFERRQSREPEHAQRLAARPRRSTGFIIAIVAAVAILFTGWPPIDPILSVLVALLILKSSAEIVRSSAHILLEGAPVGVDLAVLRSDLVAMVPAVEEVHHVHAWSLTQEQSLVTLHVRCAPDQDPEEIVPAVNGRLRKRFGILHSTVQVDHADCVNEQHR
jgi:cobalt-zinc-cadmium efflux system protein